MGSFLPLLALATGLCPIVMLLVLRARPVDEISPVEVGVVFAAIVAAYGLLPLLGAILSDNSFDLALDSRLSALSATPHDIAQIAMLHLSFLGGFCLLYALVRPRDRGFAPGDVVLRDWRLPAALAFIAVLTVVVLPNGLRWVFGVVAAEDYTGTYVELAGQPIWIQQLFGMMFSLSTVLLIAAIAAALAYDKRLAGIVSVLVVLGSLISILGGGSRLMAMIALLSLVVAYALLVRPISFRLAAVLAVTLILIFLTGQYLRDFSGEGAISDLKSALVNGEFAFVFVNGLDLAQQKDLLTAQVALPNFYAVDIARLIPQQLLPFEKLDPSRWYVTTFYPEYAATGGGLAFGAVAESALGGGVIEALIRGALLGSLFALAHGVLVSRLRRSLLGVVTYIWLVVLSYNSFRDTTFVMVGRFVLHVLPALLLIAFVMRFLRAGSNASAQPVLVGTRTP